MHPQLSCLKQRNVFPCNSGGWRFEVQFGVSRAVLSEASMGAPSLPLLTDTSVLGDTWPVGISPHLCFSLYTTCSPVCLCPNFPLLMQTSIIGLGVTLNLVGLHLTSAESLFPKEATFRGWRGRGKRGMRTSACLFERHSLSPDTSFYQLP